MIVCPRSATASSRRSALSARRRDGASVDVGRPARRGQGAGSAGHRRGRPVDVVVFGREVQVSAGPGAYGPVRLGCGDRVLTLHPGESVRFTAVGVLEDADAAADG